MVEPVYMRFATSGNLLLLRLRQYEGTVFYVSLHISKSMPDFFRPFFRTCKKFYRRQGFFRKVLFILGAFATLVLLGVVAFVGLVWAGIFGRIPDRQDLKNINHPLASEVYSADSVL